MMYISKKGIRVRVISRTKDGRVVFRIDTDEETMDEHMFTKLFEKFEQKEPNRVMTRKLERFLKLVEEFEDRDIEDINNSRGNSDKKTIIRSICRMLYNNSSMTGKEIKEITGVGNIETINRYLNEGGTDEKEKIYEKLYENCENETDFLKVRGRIQNGALI